MSLRYLGAGCALGLSLLSLFSWADAQKSVFIGEIRGMIGPASDDYLSHAIARAESAQGQALIIHLDTPGGLLTSTHSMAQKISEAKIPVIFYVSPAGSGATSAGALLVLSSHLAAMSPGSHIGAAHPVDGSGGNIGGDMRDKAVNDTVAFAQSMAELHGRNRDLAAAIVAQSKSFTAHEAVEKNIVELLADSETDLLQKLNGRQIRLNSGMVTLHTDSGSNLGLAPITRVEMTLGQKLLHILSNPNIAAILATLAMLLIYVELHTPGIQIAGGLGLICLVVSFMAFQTLPIRIGALTLMGVGIVLMIGEVIAAAHGAMAVAGVFSFILGMIWVVDPSQTSNVVSAAVWIPAALGLGVGAILIGWIASRIKKQTVEARIAIKGGGQGGLQGYEARVESLTGGEALISPFGRVQVRGELWEFVSEDPVKVGDFVKIDQVQGLKLRVSKVLAPNQ